MKHCISTSTLLVLASLFILSCSSEEEIDFTGEYRTTFLAFSDCNDTSINGLSFTADASNNFCTSDGNREECFRIVISIASDGSFGYVYSEKTTTATVSFGGPVDELSGRYTSEGRDILMCPSDGTSCLSMTLNDGNQSLEWVNADPNCLATYTLTRS